MSKEKTFKVKTHKGCTPGPMATDWWTEADWKRHEEFVEQCKDDGTYLQESEVTITLLPCPLFNDTEPSPKPNAGKHSFHFIDQSKHTL